MAVHGAEVGEISYETDRMQFIGRNRTTRAPQALLAAGALSGHQGSVLDPIVAIRYRITLEPEQTATIDIVTGHRRDARAMPGADRQIPGSPPGRSRVRTGVDP